jgi:hypothetical protein
MESLLPFYESIQNTGRVRVMVRVIVRLRAMVVRIGVRIEK